MLIRRSPPKACRYLHDVSKLRSVRMALVHRAVASDPLATPPERPAEVYSDEELERWAMRRLSVDKGWLSIRNTPVRSRRIDLSSEDTEPGVAILIEGGRWLLTTFRGGIVKSTDLDHPASPSTILISSQEEYSTHPTPLITTAICQDHSTLTFYLALLHWGFDGYVLPIYQSYFHANLKMLARRSRDVLVQSRQLCVWRVALAADGSKLLAQHLNSFSMDELGYTKAVSFTTELFARTTINPATLEVYVEVFDWRLSSSDTHYKATFQLPYMGPGSFVCVVADLDDL